MCKLIPASDFGMPDPYYRNDNHSIKNTCEDRLQNLRSRVESIELSPYLHPEVEEYTYRVLNTFLHGWYYYDLFTIASTLSIFNLELALRRKYEFQKGQRSSFGELFKRAAKNGPLKFEQTEAVQAIHRYGKEMASLRFHSFEERDIREIASNRATLVTNNLPEIRANRVHPDITSVTMPFNALRAIKQDIEYINIISDNSDQELRNLSIKAKFDWVDVTFSPLKSSFEDTFHRKVEFENRTSIPLSEVEQFINQVSQFLGLDRRKTADQLWIHNKFTLLPSKPYEELLKILNMRENQQPTILQRKNIVEGIQWIERSCIELLSDFNPKFQLTCSGSLLSFDLMKSGKTKKKWKVSAQSEKGISICYVKSNELSYYLLLQLSIWGNSVGRLKRLLRTLKKIIGGINS